MKKSTAVVCFLICSPAMATLKCVGPGGKTIYQDGTCPDGFKAYEIKAAAAPNQAELLQRQIDTLRQQQYMNSGRDPNVEYLADTYRNSEREQIQYRADRDKQSRCLELSKLSTAAGDSNSRAEANYQRLKLNCQ